MEQEMTAARCPLVREIEEAYQVVHHGDRAMNYEPADWERVRRLWQLSLHAEWPRLRAALEAAEDVVRYTDARLADGLPLEYAVIDRAIQRYRAATRTEE